MADKTYATAVGFVQFDIDERDVSGQTVRDVTIRTPGTPSSGGGALVKVTLWPEFATTDIEKGDFVAVDGTLEVRTVGDKTYLNLNASNLAVTTPAQKIDREVVNKKPARKTF